MPATAPAPSAREIVGRGMVPMIQYARDRSFASNHRKEHLLACRIKQLGAFFEQAVWVCCRNSGEKCGN